MKYKTKRLRRFLVTTVTATVISILSAAASPTATDRHLGYTGTPVMLKPKPILYDTNSVAPLNNQLRIASYNIENFQDGVNDGARTTEIAAKQAQIAAVIIERMNPDIIVLEEIENGKVLKLLNKNFSNPYPLVYLCKFGYGKGFKHHMALMSRVELEDVTVIDFGGLEGKTRPTRGVVRVTVDLGANHKLLLYGVHLKSNWGKRHLNIAKRRAGLQILRDNADKTIAKTPGVFWEIIVLGDMNTDPDSANFKDDNCLLPLKGWVDLWRGEPLEERITIPTRVGIPSMEFPPATFDRLFINNQLTNSPWTASAPGRIPEGVSHDAHIKPGEGSHASDHYPVFLDITR